jgi:hypothetical protein
MKNIIKDRYMVHDKFTKKTESWSIRYQENGKDVFDTFEVKIIKNLRLMEKVSSIKGF